LPIVFHLIRRSSKEQMPFSSLMFLQPTPPRVTKRNRLEHILLLLLRALVICLLALAFARPFLQQPLTAPLPAQGGRKIILLLDTSASMRREGLWAAALARAGDILTKTTAADQVAVFTFDRQARPFISFEQWSAMAQTERGALAAKQLTELKPGWASTHLGKALISAAEAFTEADKQGQNVGARRIVLVTDFQEGSRLDGLQGYDWPRGVEVQLESIRPQKPTNAGLQWVMDAEDAAKPATNFAPRLRVSNSSNAKREQFRLQWEGVIGAAPLDIYVPPGQSRIVAAPLLPTGAAGQRLALTGDDDDFDNSVYIVEPKPEQIRVVLVGDQTDKDPAQLSFYLRRAFQQTRQREVQLRFLPAADPSLSEELAQARLLIATGRLADSQVAAIQPFLAGGGTALFVLKNSAEAESIGRLLGVDGVTATEAVSANYAMLGVIDFESPLFAPFADPRYNDFTKIHFWKYRRLETGRLPGARVLARFDGGDAAWLEIPRGKGRLLVLTSGWQPSDSQLALSSKFVPLLYSMLDLAGGIRSPLAQVFVGDPVNLAGLAAAGTAQPITVRKPDTTQVQLAPGETSFAPTDLPGIYQATAGDRSVRFAVNLEAAESRTGPLPFDELERLKVPLKPRAVDITKQVEQKRHLHNSELEDQQKLWRWLTVAAIVLLVVETWLAGWLTRRTTLQAAGTT
jgi:hypothetical protein